MSVRDERFCDFTITEGQGYGVGELSIGSTCRNPVAGTCFYCGRDYCEAHKGYSTVTLSLSGFEIEWKQRIPCCMECSTLHLPWQIPQSITKRLEKLWPAIEKAIKKQSQKKSAKSRKVKEKKAGK